VILSFHQLESFTFYQYFNSIESAERPIDYIFKLIKNQNGIPVILAEKFPYLDIIAQLEMVIIRAGE
jgi:hypothetical protein